MIIYKITNKKNNKVYIGKTKRTLEVRKNEHLRMLKQGIHHNVLLQKHYDKLKDETMFTFTELKNERTELLAIVRQVLYNRKL